MFQIKNKCLMNLRLSTLTWLKCYIHIFNVFREQLTIRTLTIPWLVKLLCSFYLMTFKQKYKIPFYCFKKFTKHRKYIELIKVKLQCDPITIFLWKSIRQQRIVIFVKALNWKKITCFFSSITMTLYFKSKAISFVEYLKTGQIKKNNIKVLM